MVEVVERPGGTGDPEERAISELVHDLAPRALEEARRLGSEFELFEADISVELRTWTADASVVAAALAALDEHWRIGFGLVALAGEAEDVGTTLPPSLADLAAPSYYGLIVVAFQPGSSRVWLKMQKIGRAALATVLAALQITGYSWSNPPPPFNGHGHTTKPKSEQPTAAPPSWESSEFNFGVELSEETRVTLSGGAVKRLPDGCSVHVHLDAVGPERQTHFVVDLPPSEEQSAP